jgi:hypothetical protein
MLKTFEFIGVLAGILGAFLVANGMMLAGYPAFTMSSVLLLACAYKQGNANLMLLQATFLLANVMGLFNFVLKG